MMALLLLCAVTVRAWDGTGTAADPYLVKNDNDWIALATEVEAGTSHDGHFFKLATDIDITIGVGKIKEATEPSRPSGLQNN